MKFIRSSIINFDSKLIKPDLETSKTYYASINKLGNFSKKTILNKLTNEKFPNLNSINQFKTVKNPISKICTVHNKIIIFKKLSFKNICSGNSVDLSKVNPLLIEILKLSLNN